MKVHIRCRNEKVKMITKQFIENKKESFNFVFAGLNPDECRAFLLIKNRDGEYKADLLIIKYMRRDKPLKAEKSLKPYTTLVKYGKYHEDVYHYQRNMCRGQLNDMVNSYNPNIPKSASN